jgi:hypothetical protein
MLLQDSAQLCTTLQLLVLLRCAALEVSGQKRHSFQAWASSGAHASQRVTRQRRACELALVLEQDFQLSINDCQQAMGDALARHGRNRRMP